MQRECEIPAKIGFSWNKTCAQARCVLRYGACCSEISLEANQSNWQCRAGLTADACRSAIDEPTKPFFWAPGKSCGTANNTCSDVTGACCSISQETGTATCTNNLSRSACSSRKGRFSYRKRCKDVTCSAGACCVRGVKDPHRNYRYYQRTVTMSTCLDISNQSSCTAAGAAHAPPVWFGSFAGKEICGARSCRDMLGACCSVGPLGKPVCATKSFTDCEATQGEAIKCSPCIHASMSLDR